MKAAHPSPRAVLMGERRWVMTIAALAFALFSLYSVATPLFEASDELWHYPFVQRLATGGGLPIQRPGQTDADAPWRQEGSQPPLYYALSALISAPFDHSNWRDLRRLNPHADMGVPTRDGNNNAILQTADAAFPWTRAALAVRAARLASIVLSTATVVLAWLAAGEVFREASPRRRLLVMIFVACVPMFAYISGAINNDNAAVTFSAAGLWWALRLIRLRSWSARDGLVAGILTGLAALSKVSGLGLAGLFAVAAALSAWPDHGPLGDRARGFLRGLPRLLVFGISLAAAAAAIAGWWYVRNVMLYGNDLLGWEAFLDAVGRRSPPASLSQLWSEREGFFWAFWGVFGTLNVIFDPWVYDALLIVAIAAAAGILVGLIRRGRGADPVTTRQALAAALFGALVFAGLLRWSTLTPASQGRLMFPCIAALGMAWVYGLGRLHRALPGIATGALAALAIVTPWTTLIPAYAKPAPVWAERLPVPVGALYDHAIELVEAQGAPAARAGDEITLRLNWRVVAPPPINYSVFVHLVDEDGVIIAQRDMFPGQGSLATAELPAGVMWSDRYTLRIIDRERAPRAAHWLVGLYDHATGVRATLSGAPGANNGAPFGDVAVLPRQTTQPLLRYDNGMRLDSWSIEPASPRLGAATRLTLNWTADAAIAGDYVVSVQVLDDQDGKIAQSDQAPASRPTSGWPAGEMRQDVRELALRADAPPGAYRIMLVVYRPGTFARLGAYDSRSLFAGDQIELGRLRAR